METNRPPVEPPSFDQQMIDFLRTRYRYEVTAPQLKIPISVECMPQWVPSAIRLTTPVKGVWPDPSESIASPGDHACTTTPVGMIKVVADDGKTITVSLLDCEILAFRWNQKRETVLREQAENLKSQISDLKSEQTEVADES